MGFLKKFLSLFLVCCTLLGQLPALAAEVPAEVLEDPPADEMMIVFVEGSGDGVPEESVPGAPEDEAEAVPPFSSENPEEDVEDGADAEEPSLYADSSYAPVPSIYYIGKDDTGSDYCGVSFNFTKDAGQINYITVASGIEDLVIPEMIGLISPRAGVSYDPVSVEILERSGIGDWPVFVLFNDLKTVTTPSRLHIVGKNAFLRSPLEAVYLNNGLTTIGAQAFQDSANLKSIRLPASVTEVGANVFYRCTALESAVWSKNAALIPDWAFANCFSLTSIKIPTGVTQLGKRAFYQCTSLEEITIPEGVTELPSEVFRDSGLKKIYLPRSLKVIQSNAFSNCSIEHFYFAGSEAEWNAIAYTKYVRVPVTFNYVAPNAGSVASGTVAPSPFVPKQDSLPDTEQKVEWKEDTWSPSNSIFRVYARTVESNSPSFTDLSVSANGYNYNASGNSGSYREITIQNTSDYTGNFTVTAAGYHDLTLPSSVVSTLNDVVLTPSSVKGPFVQTLLQGKGNSSSRYFTNVLLGSCHNVVYMWNPLSGKDPEPQRYYVDVNWNGHGVGTVWLQQGSKRVNLENSGFTETAIQQTFTPDGGEILLCVQAADGTTDQRKTGLAITRENHSSLNFDLGVSSNFDFPEETDDNSSLIPGFVGGSTASIDFSILSDSKFPIKYKWKDDGTVIGIIGITLDEDSDMEYACDEAREVFQKAKDMQTINGRNPIKDLKKCIGAKAISAANAHDKAGIKTSVELIGYFTGKRVNGRMQFTEIKIAMEFSGSASRTSYVLVGGVVPGYFKVALSASLELALKMELKHEDDQAAPTLTPPDKVNVEVSAGLAVGAGPGWEGFASVGIEGSGSVTLKFTLPLTLEDLEGTMSGKIYVVGSLNGVPGKWELLVTPEMVFFENGNVTWHPKEETVQLSSFQPDLRESNLVFYANNGANAIATVSGYHAPALAQLSGGRLLAVWVADVSGRSAMDRSGVYYSIREQSGTWSTPQLVWDDGTNDSAPQLWTLGGEVYLTWQNYSRQYNQALSSSPDYQALYGQMKIAAAKFDRKTNTFTDAGNLSNGGATQPRMALVDGAPALVWQEAPWRQDGQSAQYAALYASIYESGWSAAEETDAEWYQVETAAPSTYQDDLPATASRIQVLDTRDCQAVLYTETDSHDIANVYGLFNSGYGWGKPVQLTHLTAASVAGFSAVISGNTLQILVTEVTGGGYASAGLVLYERALAPSISLGDVDYIHGSLIPGETVTLAVDVTNDGIDTVKNLKVLVGYIDSTIEQSLDVSLLPGETKTVYATYTPPILQERYPPREIPFTITSDTGASVTGECPLMYTDVSIESLTAELGSDGKTHISAIVANRSYKELSGYSVTFYQEGGAVNEKTKIGSMPCSGLLFGRAVSVSMDCDGLEEGTMIYAEVAKDSGAEEENLYGNNVSETAVQRPFSDVIGITALLNSANTRQVAVTDPLGQLTNGTQVFAASYDTNGKLTGTAEGTLSGGTVTFNKNLAPGWTLFFTNPQTRAPLCGKVTLQ